MHIRSRCPLVKRTTPIECTHACICASRRRQIGVERRRIRHLNHVLDGSDGRPEGLARPSGNELDECRMHDVKPLGQENSANGSRESLQLYLNHMHFRRGTNRKLCATSTERCLRRKLAYALAKVSRYHQSLCFSFFRRQF